MYPSTASVTGMSLAEGANAPNVSQSKRSLVDTTSASDQFALAALKLGVNPKDLASELIPVDRQSLLQMLNAESVVDGMNDAEYFFDSVTTATATYIRWPRGLRMNARRSKDPHVRILGTQSEVARAKEYILARMEAQGNRVFMKIDVSYLEHSHIIGPGGKNIKSIKEATTSCVHFPDSNRSSAQEKSNIVSLYGSLAGVEHARALVRLAPTLSFAFELPTALERPQPHPDTPYVNMIEEKFKVNILFSPTLNSVWILVQGYEQQAAQVHAATQMLINLSCGDMARQTLVQMHLEISPQHHEIVKGHNNTKVSCIMKHTKTTIIFPDLLDMHMSPCKKSQVTIWGTVDGVYRARQQLLGNLPITLIFDLPADRMDGASDLIMDLKTKYGLKITLNLKQKEGHLPVITIKGIEKAIGKIYAAHHEILRLSSAVVKPDIPESYYSPWDPELSFRYHAALCTPRARISSFSTQKLYPKAATDGRNLTNYSAASTSSSDSDNSDRVGRRSSAGVGRLSFGASTLISPNLPCSADSYRDMHFDVEHDHKFDIDMGHALEPTSTTTGDELFMPNTNWMVLDNMIGQCGDISGNASLGFFDSAATVTERRHSIQW